jgi:hypothetical protein
MEGLQPFTRRITFARKDLRRKLRFGLPLAPDVARGEAGTARAVDPTLLLTRVPEYAQMSALSENPIPWMPRAGAHVVAQFYRDVPIEREDGTWSRNDINLTDKQALRTRERLYIAGGFASWPTSDPRYDGERARNDVWYTYDGMNWTLATKHAGWPARAWGAMTVRTRSAPVREGEGACGMARLS